MAYEAAGRCVRTLLAVVLAFGVCFPQTIAFADEPADFQPEMQGDSLQEGDAEADGVADDAVEAPSGEPEPADEAGDEQASSADGRADSGADPSAADESDASGSAGSASSAASDTSASSGSAGAAAGESGASGSASSAASGTSASSGSAAASSSSAASPNAHEATDIAPAWREGDVRIDKAGEYTLSGDVTTSHQLIAALPEGQSATIDLAGHTAIVEGDAALAIDLSENAGAITFTDSTYAAAHAADSASDPHAPAPAAAIVLKSTDAQGPVAVAHAVMADSTRNASPHATFENVNLEVDFTANTVAACAQPVAALRTGLVYALATQDETDAREVGVTLRNTTLVAKASSGVPDEALAEAGLEPSGRGAVSAIDAQSRGVVIEGYFTASAQGPTESTATAHLSSVLEHTFKLVADANLPDDVVFGMPARAAEAGAAEAVVATTVDDVPFAGAADKLKAASGLEAHLNDARTQLMVAQVAQEGDNPEAQAEQQGEQPGGTSAETPAEKDPNAKDVTGADMLNATLAAQTLSNTPELEAALGIQANVEVDLNADWQAQEGGLQSTYTITSGGTYYLSADLETENGILVNAPNKEVTIRFNGHTLRASGSGGNKTKSIVRIKAADTVTFDGSSPSGASTIVSRQGEGDADMFVISQEGSFCDLIVENMTLRLGARSTALRFLGTHCIRSTSGSAWVRNCIIDMDFGNQGLTGDNSMAATEPTSALFFSKDTRKVEIENCSVRTVGSPVVSVADVSETKALGNAYGLHSMSMQTRVSGCTFDVTSASGCAAAMFARKLTVEGDAVTVNVQAGQIAAGILSIYDAGATINAPVRGTVSAEATGSSCAAMLRSTVENGFVFGANGADTPYSTLVMTGDLGDANADGAKIGSVAGLSSAQADRWRASVTNALGASGSCVAEVRGDGLFFALKNTAAAAAAVYHAVNGSTTYHATFNSALAAVNAGDTLTLMRDVGDVTITRDVGFTFEMGGHAANSVSYRAGKGASSAGLVLQNGRVIGSTLTVDGGSVAVYHGSPNSLTLRNMSVSLAVSNSVAAAVFAASSATGELIVDDCTLSVAAERTQTSVAAYGVRMNTGCAANLALNRTSVTVRTASAGLSVCGVEMSAKTTISQSAIKIEGTTATTGGVNVQAGMLNISNTSIDVWTSDKASTAYGIWNLAAVSQGAVAANGCDVRVRAAVSVSEGYWGLRDELGVSALGTRWVLDGTSTFTCASGAHMGPKMGVICLGDAFSLAGGSDKPLVVSQVLCDGDVGFASYSGSRDLSSLAASFAPLAGSAYEGWQLQAEGSGVRLAWMPAGAPASGAVVVVHANGTSDNYRRFSDALAASKTGDTVRLACDVREATCAAVPKATGDLVIDLAGYALTLSAGADAVSSARGAALTYAGGSNRAGTLRITDSSSSGAGSLALEVGSSVETADAVYCGMAVTGGTVAVDGACRIEVNYVGGDGTASQYDTDVQGICVAGGALVLDGTLRVAAPQAARGFGVHDLYGVFVTAVQGTAASVKQGSASNIEVENLAQAPVINSIMYYEAASDRPASRPYVREVAIDPVEDAAFYNAIQEQFRKSAYYDNPNNYSPGSEFGTGVYYTSGYLAISEPGAWYDGALVWAYSDVVPTDDVGKMSSIVATHFFMQTVVDRPTNAVGIASDANAQGAVNVSIAGNVRAKANEGSAYALNAAGTNRTSWNVAGARLSANADMRVHAVDAGELDLRDFIAFAQDPGKKVFYRAGGYEFGLAEFQAPVARGSIAGDGVSFTMDANTQVSTTGADAEDAPAGWGAAGDVCVEFRVGGATVARYKNAASINLGALAAKTRRLADVRESYDFAGWSANADENAPAQFGTSGTLKPTRSMVLNAVYATKGTQNIPVTFTNIHDGQGAYLANVSFSAAYGQTLGQAARAAGKGIPRPADYTDANGVVHRFVGWHAYVPENETSTLAWNPSMVADFLVVDIGASGVRKGSLTLRAVYVAVSPGMHLITFQVDSKQAAYAVEDGVRPKYRSANPANGNSEAPSKVDTVTGVTYTFKEWRQASTGAAYTYILPVAKADATYVASFDEEGSAATLTFYYLQPNANGSAGYERRSKVVETTYATPVQSVADSLVRIGERIMSGGVMYTFLGWSPRSTDIEPVYGAGNPIASGNWAERIVSSQAYSTTYYGVYSSEVREITVSFFNGDQLLGSARMPSTRTVQSAFGALGIAEPADRSETEAFRGWATSPDAAEEVRPSDYVGDLAGTSNTLSLYAVFGSPFAYSVRFRSLDRATLLYDISVARGNTVAKVAGDQGVFVSGPQVSGMYFKGWITAAGSPFSIDEPVTGAVEVHPALYGTLSYDFADPDDSSAVVACTAYGLQDATKATFSLAPASQPDSALRSFTSEYGYTIIKSYHMALTYTNADGSTGAVSGHLGQADVKVYVGKAYAHMKVRAFWLGPEAKILNSSDKGAEIDDEGYITISIGSFDPGDVSEGGNLAIAFVQGEGAAGMLEDANANQAARAAAVMGAGKSLAELGLAPSQMLLNGANMLSNMMAGKGDAAKDGKNSASGKNKSADGEDGADATGEEGLGEDHATIDAFVFILLLLGVMAIAARGLWWLLVKRRRDNAFDDDDESGVGGPALQAGVIRF